MCNLKREMIIDSGEQATIDDGNRADAVNIGWIGSGESIKWIGGRSSVEWIGGRTQLMRWPETLVKLDAFQTQK